MRSTTAASAAPSRTRSPQIPHTVGSEGYAVVSCHVERLLDDRIFARYVRFVARRPFGFAVASLVRPPDPEVGEREEPWVERVRQLAAHGPLGQHTHFGGLDQARPREGDPAGRVAREAQIFVRHGLAATWFCGGGWYVDAAVAEAAAAAGYRDCTGTSFRPAYLAPGAPRLPTSVPTWLRVGGRRLLELPTTHSVGAAARASLGRLPPGLVHVYFHDYELVEPRRRAALVAALAALRLRRRVADLDELAARLGAAAPEAEFASLAEPAA